MVLNSCRNVYIKKCIHCFNNIVSNACFTNLNFSPKISIILVSRCWWFLVIKFDYFISIHDQKKFSITVKLNGMNYLISVLNFNTWYMSCVYEYICIFSTLYRDTYTYSLPSLLCKEHVFA